MLQDDALNIFRPVLHVNLVGVPALDGGEILAQVGRFEVQAVVEIVQEKAQLVVDVRRAEVLRRRAEEHHFMVAAPEIVREGGVPLRRVVAEVVDLVHEHDAPVRVRGGQVNAARLDGFGIDILPPLLVVFGGGRWFEGGH